MKQYFAKYIPVDGEINFNDYYYSVVLEKVNRYLEIREEITRPNPEDKKVKLFLCSKVNECPRCNNKENIGYCRNCGIGYSVYKVIGEIVSDTPIEEYTEYDIDEFVTQCKYCMLSGETDLHHRMGCENKSKESLIVKMGN